MPKVVEICSATAGKQIWEEETQQPTYVGQSPNQREQKQEKGQGKKKKKKPQVQYPGRHTIRSIEPI